MFLARAVVLLDLHVQRRNVQMVIVGHLVRQRAMPRVKPLEFGVFRVAVVW